MNLPPVIKFRELDANGAPLAGGKLYTYQAGTTTPQATYTDSGGLTPNANPVVLDAAGRADVWLDPSLSYKFVMKDSTDVQLWSQDNVIGLLTANSVNTASLQALCVTTAKLALNSVDSTILKSDAAVDANRAVQTNHIRDAQVTRAKMAAGAVPTLSIAAKTANYTVTSSDDILTGDSSGGTFTFTLPSAAANQGRVFKFKKIDSTFTAITIARAGSDTIDGSTSTTLNSQYEMLEIVSDGSSKWLVIARTFPTTWTSYSPTTQGFGTITSSTFKWRRKLGGDVEIFAQFTTGNPTASEMRCDLPTGLTVAATLAANAWIGHMAQQNVAPVYAVLANSGNTYVQFGDTAATAHFGPTVGSGNINSSALTEFTCSVPITGWN